MWWGNASGASTFLPPSTPSPDVISTTYSCNNQPAQGLPYIGTPTGSNLTVMYSRSRHTGGVNAGLGDGSVRFIRDGVSQDRWRAMGTRTGGEVSNLD